MSEVHEAFSRDPAAIERLQRLHDAIEDEKKATVEPLRAVLAHRQRAPTELWSAAELRAVVEAAWCAGRRRGADQCSDAIFGRLSSEEEPPDWWANLFDPDKTAGA